MSASEAEILYAVSQHSAGAESQQAAETYFQLVRPWLKAADSWLDVGCSDGAFLQKLSLAGIKSIRGTEPSESAVHSASAIIRKSIYRGTVQQLREAERETHYSAISCFQVLEHLEDPLAALRDLRNMLASDGLLFLVTHDFRSPLNRLAGKRSPIYDLQHFQIFSRGGLANALKAAGFSTLECRSFWNRYTFRYLLKLQPFPWLRAAANSPAWNTWSGRLPLLPLPAGNLFTVAKPC
jgi:SAM-dependent methyltransferase